MVIYPGAGVASSVCHRYSASSLIAVIYMVCVSSFADAHYRYALPDDSCPAKDHPSEDRRVPPGKENWKVDQFGVTPSQLLNLRRGPGFAPFATVEPVAINFHVNRVITSDRCKYFSLDPDGFIE